MTWVPVYFCPQSPDGDVIDCVLSHLQPAFDHPELKGQKPLVISMNYLPFFKFGKLMRNKFIYN